MTYPVEARPAGKEGIYNRRDIFEILLDELALLVTEQGEHTRRDKTRTTVVGGGGGGRRNRPLPKGLRISFIFA